MSAALSGHQWYSNTTGVLTGATLSWFHPDSPGEYYAIVNDDGCYSEASNTIAYSLTDVENNYPDKEITVYPSPVTGMLNIVSNTELKSILITGIVGNILYENPNVSDKNFEMDMTAYNPGYYLISIRTHTGSRIVRKILKL
jgi:hypothetical protein